MNTLRITLLISLAAQVCLSAGILAAAEEGPLAFGTIPLALLSLVVVDLARWVRPNAWILNLAALAGLAAAYQEFGRGGESRILAGAHLLVYIQWTFLLQAKELRRMWWMFALSILQVAVAAVLTIQPWFGAAMFLYTVMTIWTMSLLSLARAAWLANRQMWDREDQSPLAPIVRVRDRSSSRNGFRVDDRGRWVTPRFLGGVVLTFLGAIVVGVLFFVLTPRVWIGSTNPFSDGGRRGASRTGFTETVRLGDVGRITESDELVMQIEGVEIETQTPVPPQRLVEFLGTDPYFRGTYLNTYQPEGQWSFNPQGVVWEPFRTRLNWTRDNMVLLKIRVQPTGSPVLFLHERTLRVGGTEETEEIHFNEERYSLERPVGAGLEQPFDYRMIILDQSQDWHQLWRDVRWGADRMQGLNANLRSCLKNTNERVARRAREICKIEPGEALRDPDAVARLLESYLRDSPEFSYTLDNSRDDPSIDPVEDFLFNRKRGHCEYFASALALMLRGVGIPSRLVSGFKGAEYNEKSGKFEVRALHAHAWVEGYVNGGWVIFDATPPERESQVAEKARMAQNSLVEQTRGAWFFGMSYSQTQQEQLVYGPLRQAGLLVRQNFEGLMDGHLPILNQMKAVLTSPQDWSSGTGALLLGLLSGLIALAVGVGRNLWKRWTGMKRSRDIQRRRSATIEFYERLLLILKKSGMVDDPAQTPRELAASVEKQWASRLAGAGLAGGVGRLVESFYTVRFGGEPLSTEELRDVETTLQLLDPRPAAV